MAAYHRYNQASLLSNAAAVPVFAEQSRHHAVYGLLRLAPRFISSVTLLKAALS